MARCTCTNCGLTFTGLAAFDRHQKQRGDKVTCLSPDTVKLGGYETSDGTVVWGTGPPRDGSNLRKR